MNNKLKLLDRALGRRGELLTEKSFRATYTIAVGGSRMMHACMARPLQPCATAPPLTSTHTHAFAPNKQALTAFEGQQRSLERVDKYSTWLAQYQLLLLPTGGAGDDAAATHSTIEVRLESLDESGRGVARPAGMWIGWD